MPHTLALELVVQDIAGVRVAGAVDATRVELTQALAVGGLTPSPALTELAVETAREVGVEVHVLVRPRPGGFRYDAEEIAVIERDVRRAVDAGAHGVVIGALGGDGTLDLDAMARLRDAADGASVTLHRAIDVTPDPVATLAAARGLGLRRVLTSGAAPSALAGIDTIRRLVVEAAGEIEVMAGSGVDAACAPALASTGLDALHSSSQRAVPPAADAPEGSVARGFGGYEQTDLSSARALADVIASLRAGASA